MRDVRLPLAAVFLTAQRQQAMVGEMAQGLLKKIGIIRRCAQNAYRLLAARVGASFAELNEPQKDAARHRLLSRVQFCQRGVGAARHRHLQTGARRFAYLVVRAAREY